MSEDDKDNYFSMTVMTTWRQCEWPGHNLRTIITHFSLIKIVYHPSDYSNGTLMKERADEEGETSGHV